MNPHIIEFQKLFQRKLSPRSRAVAECLISAARFDALGVCAKGPDKPYPHALKIELLDRWAGLSEAERGAVADLRNGKLVRWHRWLGERVCSAIEDLPQLVLLERQFRKPLSNCHDYPWRVHER